MVEYIEREAALRVLCDACGNAACPKGLIPRCSYYEKMQSIPAADVRPVVTCGECKHWFENGTDYCSCDRDALLRERDFFCAGGEKRGES